MTDYRNPPRFDAVVSDSQLFKLVKTTHKPARSELNYHWKCHWESWCWVCGRSFTFKTQWAGLAYLLNKLNRNRCCWEHDHHHMDGENARPFDPDRSPKYWLVEVLDN